MPPSHSSFDHKQFSQWVQDALNRLYDSPYLQTHPLGAAFALDGAHPVQQSQQLRKLLMDAI